MYVCTSDGQAGLSTGTQREGRFAVSIDPTEFSTVVSRGYLSFVVGGKQGCLLSMRTCTTYRSTTDHSSPSTQGLLRLSRGDTGSSHDVS